MKTFTRFYRLAAAVVLPVLLSLGLHAQTAITQTTLAAALAETGNQINLASATGVTTAVNGSPVTIAYVDTEAIAILTVAQGQTTIFNVLRGQYGTPVEAHSANAVVYIQNVSPQYGGFSGAGGLEVTNPPVQGTCVSANQNTDPWINMVTGQQWTCASYTTAAGNSMTGWVPVSLPLSPNANAPLTIWAPSASAYTNATTSFTSVPGMAFYAEPNRNYQATCRIVWQGSASTTGPKYEFTGPASPTAVALSGMLSVTTSTYLAPAASTAFGTGIANNGTVTTATNLSDTVSLGVVNGSTGGVVQLKAAADGTGTLTIEPGSYCVVQ